MTYNEKLAKFKHQTLMFLKSPREAEDLFRFAVAVYAATTFGSGLLFDELEEVIDESYKEVPVPGPQNPCGYCNGTGDTTKG